LVDFKPLCDLDVFADTNNNTPLDQVMGFILFTQLLIYVILVIRKRIS